MNQHADVLLVTVTKVESRAVMAVFQKVTGQPAVPQQIQDKMYFDLGVVNHTRLWLVLSEMGAGGLGGAQQTVQKGIDALAPGAVVMVGIAFGMDAQKQQIGDILVSQQLRLYDLQRVGAEIMLRGDKPHASPWLIDRCRAADLVWDGPTVRCGVILTGEKLVDHIDYRAQLQRFEPEAIGGEMEGAGLYVACQDQKVDWILVKAICDWADGQKAQEKAQRQQLAATNAARFVLHVLQQAPLTRRSVDLSASVRGEPVEPPRISPFDKLRANGSGTTPTLPPELRRPIVDFLSTLPNMQDSHMQQALITGAGLDAELERLIQFGGATAFFVDGLVSTLSSYGRLADGRHALVAILQAAQNYVGADRRRVADGLIDRLK